MAMALLGALRKVPAGAIQDVVWLAELGLDGRLRPVRGVLPALVAARAAGITRAVVAQGNAAEAALIPDLDVRAAHDLRQLIDWLDRDGAAPPYAEPVLSRPSGRTEPTSSPR